MKNVVDFPDMTAIDDEAAAWLVRLDAEIELSEEERAQIGEWLNRSPVHRERLLKLAATWENLNVLTELAVPLVPSTPSRPGHVRFLTTFFAASAAVVALSAMLFVYLQWLAPAPYTATNGLYSTEIGKHRSTVLADESELYLNTNSKVRVDFSENYRDVYLLQGEVLFVVTKDEHRRFRVYAGGSRIDAVGTAFSVYLRDDEIDITVTEGEVALSAAAEIPMIAAGDGQEPTRQAGATELGTLHAGQIATLSRVVEPSGYSVTNFFTSPNAREEDLKHRLSWIDGNVAFSGESLENVINEISRYTTTEIEFADPELKAMRIGGLFPVGETRLMFETLEMYGLDVTYLSIDRVLISADQ